MRINRQIDMTDRRCARLEGPGVDCPSKEVEYAMGPYLEYARVHKKTASDDESKLRMWILPKLGHKRLCDITRHDIDMHRTEMSKTHTQGTANRHHALLALSCNGCVHGSGR